MLPPKINLPPEQRALLQLYKRLAPQDQAALIAFAEFLDSRGRLPEAAAAEQPLAEPKSIPRPPDESVVGAIRRLSESYFMLERGELLNHTSTLMTAHIMHGRTAEEIIDELEEFFAERYAQFIEQK